MSLKWGYNSNNGKLVAFCRRKIVFYSASLSNGNRMTFYNRCHLKPLHKICSALYRKFVSVLHGFTKTKFAAALFSTYVNALCLKLIGELPRQHLLFYLP